MSTSIAVAGSPEPKPVSVSAVASTPGRIFSSLPRIWIGFAITGACFLSLIVEFASRTASGLAEASVWVLSMVGSFYWLFCIHRIHRVLAQYTRRTYPIAPWRVVALQFIPLFEYYWFFRWTRRLATFLNQRAPGSPAPMLWPGFLLTGASLIGIVPFGLGAVGVSPEASLKLISVFKCVRLLLIFSLGLYYNRRLRPPVLPAPRPLSVRHWHRLKLSVSAGVGAAFTFVLVHGLRHFIQDGGSERFRELAHIFLVSIGVLIFLEPVFDRLRELLGVAHDDSDHADIPRRQSWRLRFALFLIVALTSFSHGLIDSELKRAFDHGPHASLNAVLANEQEADRRADSGPVPLSTFFGCLLVVAGITYFWIGASHCHPSHAARSGLLTGLLLGGLLAVIAAIVTSPSAIQSESTGRLAAFFQPFALIRVLSDFPPGFLIALPWPILGFVGGFAIDRRWGGSVHNVALTMLIASVIFAIALRLNGNLDSFGEIASFLSVAAGWGLSLIVCSSAKVLMPKHEEEATRALRLGSQLEATT